MEKETKISPELIEHQAGNIALFNISERYFKVICASLFAIILANPELVLTLTVNLHGHIIGLNYILGYYLIFGIVGLFIFEFYKAAKSLLNAKDCTPVFLKNMFILYFGIGFLLLSFLLTELLEI